jgi:hypothetical protein
MALEPEFEVVLIVPELTIVTVLTVEDKELPITIASPPVPVLLIAPAELFVIKEAPPAPFNLIVAFPAVVEAPVIKPLLLIPVTLSRVAVPVMLMVLKSPVLLMPCDAGVVGELVIITPVLPFALTAIAPVTVRLPPVEMASVSLSPEKFCVVVVVVVIVVVAANALNKLLEVIAAAMADLSNKIRLGRTP